MQKGDSGSNNWKAAILVSWQPGFMSFKIVSEELWTSFTWKYWPKVTSWWLFLFRNSYGDWIALCFFLFIFHLDAVFHVKSRDYCRKELQKSLSHSYKIHFIIFSLLILQPLPHLVSSYQLISCTCNATSTGTFCDDQFVFFEWWIINRSYVVFYFIQLFILF